MLLRYARKGADMSKYQRLWNISVSNWEVNVTVDVSLPIGIADQLRAVDGVESDSVRVGNREVHLLLSSRDGWQKVQGDITAIVASIPAVVGEDGLVPELIISVSYTIQQPIAIAVGAAA